MKTRVRSKLHDVPSSFGPFFTIHRSGPHTRIVFDEQKCDPYIVLEIKI